MPFMGPADAVREARRLLGLTAGDEGAAFRVRRLDRPGASYFIVHTDGHVACLDEETRALMASAETPQSPVTLTQEAALGRAGLGNAATAELVWSPGAASQSIFDPVWLVSHAGHTAYVDQRGHVSQQLKPRGPGGGSG
jgi:hypothetical protein